MLNKIMFRQYRLGGTWAEDAVWMVGQAEEFLVIIKGTGERFKNREDAVAYYNSRH